MKQKTARTIYAVSLLCGLLILIITLFLHGTAQNVTGTTGLLTLVAGAVIRFYIRCPACEKRLPIFAEGYLVTHCPFCGEALDEEETS